MKAHSCRLPFESAYFVNFALTWNVPRSHELVLTINPVKKHLSLLRTICTKPGIFLSLISTDCKTIFIAYFLFELKIYISITIYQILKENREKYNIHFNISCSASVILIHISKLLNQRKIS